MRSLRHLDVLRKVPASVLECAPHGHSTNCDFKGHVKGGLPLNPSTKETRAKQTRIRPVHFNDHNQVEGLRLSTFP